MNKEQYYYAVTRIHNDEAFLLNAQSVERMRQAADFSGCVNVLREHGWAAEDTMSVKEIIEARQEKMWSFLAELITGTDILDLFKYEHDFNNIKAVIRLGYSKRANEFSDLYISKYGSIAVNVLKECLVTGAFNKLPELFSVPAAEANRLLLQTGSGQLSDAVLDRASVEAMAAAAKRMESGVLMRYAGIKADIANVMIAVRGIRMNKTADFYSLAMADTGGLSKQELQSATLKGIDTVYAYLTTTEYASCVEALKQSLTFFQAEAESRIIEFIKPLKYTIGGADCIFAFIIARESELSMVRLLLSSKINQFPSEFVSGCLRRTYA